ncbi:MAG: pyridoxamine 5'-phosphate oxidase family protein [Chloroflexota bacterium]
MSQQLSSAQVWQDMEKEMFAVLGMVTANQEARTVGIVYAVRDRKLYISSGKDAWKVKHIARNPCVSLTVTIAKQIPLMPWIKIPAATITFNGHARILDAAEVSQDKLASVLGRCLRMQLRWKTWQS